MQVAVVETMVVSRPFTSHRLAKFQLTNLPAAVAVAKNCHILVNTQPQSQIL